MLIQFGNNHSVAPGLDSQPKITTVHVPEADEHGLGGYTHAPGAITTAEMKAHLMDAITRNREITQLPDHEILVSLLHPIRGAWGYHGQRSPTWVHVIPHEQLHGVADPRPNDQPDHSGARPAVVVPHSADVAKDVEAFLADYFKCPTADRHFNATDPEELAVKKELTHWTITPPGEMPPALGLPPATALYTNDGRALDNIADGGGQVGYTNAATATTATTLTQTGATWTTNQWAGYRVYGQSSTSNMVWGNVVSNTATVLTVDRWYSMATPGGAAGSTPTSTTPFAIADGGSVSAWFVGLATGANAPAATDHTLATNGNVEITTAGGGLIRKIAPYAQTSGVASRSYTLTPVYTANGSDSLPAVVTTIGVFVSMVTTDAFAMKFETALTASATMSAIGDQLTVTETVTGS